MKVWMLWVAWFGYVIGYPFLRGFTRRWRELRRTDPNPWRWSDLWR